MIYFKKAILLTYFKIFSKIEIIDFQKFLIIYNKHEESYEQLRN